MFDDKVVQLEYRRLVELRKDAKSEHCKSVITGLTIALRWVMHEDISLPLPSDHVVEMLAVEALYSSDT